MTYWYGSGMSGWGYLLMAASTLLFWTLLIFAGVTVFRAVQRPAGPGPGAPPPPPMTPEQILGDRLACGDIDEDEYRRRLETLHAAD